MLQKDAKKSPPKVEAVQKVNPKDSGKKKEVEDFKLAKFKNVESKVKPLMSSQNTKWYKKTSKFYTSTIIPSPKIGFLSLKSKK